MTRFEMEISGNLGDYWIKHAESEVNKIRAEIARGEITVDERGVLRNCIGRVATSEVAEMCSYIGYEYNADATSEQRHKDDIEAIERYCKSREGVEPTAEELSEMRAVFGKGASVTNIFTGEHFSL